MNDHSFITFFAVGENGRGGSTVPKIKRAAVLGAGVMGAAIAGHLANVGIPTYLLDIVPRELTEEEKRKGLTLDDPRVRNRLAQAGKDRLLKEKPSPLYHREIGRAHV